jgi:CubicO group peptidase (beta-lactamase class C family)
MADIVAWHGKTFNEHIHLRDDAAQKGYRFLSLSIYGSTSSPCYAAVMIKRANIVAQRDFPALTADQFQNTFNDQARQGYGPVMIAATGSSSNPLFAAVFQPQNPILLTRHRLTSGADSDLNTIQGMNKQAKSSGLILKWAASYGDSDDPRFAAIWEPNGGKTLWNNDGLLDTVAEYQARFNAQASAWCRPAFVTLDTDSRYLSLFVNNEIGPWVARHNLSPTGYQKEFDTNTENGFFPICVQAAGGDKDSAHFAALFVKSESIVAKTFQATGPVANAGIDAIIQKAMQESPVRNAALAIVKGKQLVYARGYTLCEPGWPVVQPTTCFRMASDSKIITALAIFQLIQSGDLHLTDKVQDILKLKTPAGGNPTDVRFNDITVQHLLEHTSGLRGDDFRNGAAVKTAFDQAGKPATLPVSAAMTDSYIAGLTLLDAPGDSHYYNNCGYYLLGRIVAKKRNKEMINAYQDHLFSPLSIKRIRLAANLISAQPPDEARYQGPDLLLAQSVMTPDQPLVPYEYGTEDLTHLAGAGGLTGAVTDIAQIIAILISQDDNPALPRTAITDMLSKGVAFQSYLQTPAGMALLAKGKALTGDGGARAGYGFDVVSNLGGGQFYAQKGGNLIECCNSVVQFNGTWGFVMCWASPPSAANGWYPDYPDVMNIARNTAWAADLFPSFGMSSL